MEIILGALGGLVVAIAQFFGQRRNAWEQRLYERTADAYSDFLVALSDSTSRRASPSVGKSESQIALIRAKTHIAIYGNPEVIGALALWERAGGIVDSEEHQRHVVTLVKEMRRDIGSRKGKYRTLDEDLTTVLFGYPAR